MQFLTKTLLTLTALTIAISAQAQWKKGAYYDTNGNRYAGLIKKDEQHILYKPTKKDKEQKLAAAELSAFVYGDDTVSVSRSPLFEQPVFLEVMTNGPTKIYVARPHRKKFTTGSIIGGVMGGQTGADVGGAIGAIKKYHGYYYGSGPDSLDVIDMKNFAEVTSRIMADKPKVAAKIKDKTYRYGDMDELVIFYNTGVEPPLND